MLRGSLKMPPSPTLLQDNDPKEIWGCDQDWEGPTEVKCAGREGCVVPKRLIFATLKGAWVFFHQH